MSKATLHTRPADVCGALDASLTDSLLVSIGCLHVSYFGTADQLKSEGLFPAGFRWEAEPEIESRAFVWVVGELRFSITRKRPPSIRMKAPEWAERGLWHVRSERLHPECGLSRELRAAAKRFNAAVEAATPEVAERRRHLLKQACDAGRDTRLQAFLSEVKRQARPQGRRVL
jgi:hypothetical protein